MNNRKQMKNNIIKEKVIGFLKESGFYILVVLGLCAVAAGAVFYTTNNLIPSPNIQHEAELEQNNNKAIVDNSQELEPYDTGLITEARYEAPEEQDPSIAETIIDETPSEVVDTGIDKPDNLEAINDTEKGMEAEQQEDAAQASAVVKAEPKNQSANESKATNDNNNLSKENEDTKETISLFDKKISLEMPVRGDIQKEFAMDKLLYSKTLDEWRTHSGVDISAPRGEVVKSAADGVVTEIKNDPRYGITIVIDHQNGFKTVYSNLACDNMVSPNQKVKALDAISSIGNTAIFECAEPSHLHFELYKNDKLVNPLDYMKK